MTERFHFPPVDVSISDDTPLVFLAGPIRGAPDWQKSTAAELLLHRPDIEVASPRRYTESDFRYEEQVVWEKKQLRRSAKFGAAVFWFAAQDFTLPYEPGRSYAQTSRIEIGRLLGWHDYVPFPLIVGFDREYTPNGGGNQRYIESACAEKDIEVVYTLNDIIDKTITATPRSR